jgi:chromosome segregation ATPase
MSEKAAPEQVRKFAPKRKPELHPTDQAGEALIVMLKEAAKLSDEKREQLMDMTHDLSRQLQTAQDRIDRLEEDVEHFRGRAASAERWLELIEKEIEQTLIAPMSVRWREQASVQ